MPSPKIPFTLNTKVGIIAGHLSAPIGAGMDSVNFPKDYHVMVEDYYLGCLMLNPNRGWWLPDSNLENYADQLGNVVELWFE